MVEIKRNHFTSRDQAVNEIASLGLHLYETEAEKGSEDETHWHPYDTHIYVLEGEYEHREPGEPSIIVGAGDYQMTPARVLHSSLITKAVKVVFGTSEPVDPDKPRHSPDEL